MTDCKDVYRVTEDILLSIYTKQTQDRKVRFLWDLYMRLNEEEQDAFLQIATDTAKSKDKYYHRQ